MAGSRRSTATTDDSPGSASVEPALRLAREGTEFPEAHAACLGMLAAVMTMNEGERGSIRRAGTLLRTGDTARSSRGSSAPIGLLADEGPRTYYGARSHRVLLEADGGARRPASPRPTSTPMKPAG